MSVRITSMAQAGFLLEAGATVIGLDLYLSDCCERLFGFARLIPAPRRPEELKLDFLVSTHAHNDHLDIDALPVFAADPAVRFIGAADCRETYENAGIAPSRFTLLRPGETAAAGDFTVRAVAADHGELAPEALGLVFSCGEENIYVTGDTGFNPDLILPSLGDTPVAVMIAPVNGAFGNLTKLEAARLANLVRPGALVAAHFGMFAAHDGDPGSSWEALRRALDADIELIVPEPGEVIRR